jgi:class 3 adenylate cyclase
MFADVVGSTAMGEQLPAETYRLIMDRCLRQLNQSIDDFGGTVLRLMGDGLLAFFCTPKAHEDDPVRAALASLRIHERIGSYAKELGQPLQVRVGINTGRVVMGSMGGDIFSEYTGMGMPVVLAARLESAASPGQTLISETTARLIDRQFELQPTGPLSLKGFTEPVIAFELVAELTQPNAARGPEDLHSPLVGRDDVLREVNDLLQGLEAGRGGICTVIAGPGIGKSRLLQEVEAENATRQLRWAGGRAYSYSQEQPFGVIVDLLADLLGLSADDTPALMDLKLERV